QPDLLLRLELGSAKPLDCRRPYSLKGRARASRKLQYRCRGAFALQQFVSRQLVQRRQSICKRVILITDSIHIMLQVEHREFSPRTLAQKVCFLLVESELTEDCGTMEIRFVVPLAIQIVNYVVAPRVGDR